jgi:hypothetical protein
LSIRDPSPELVVREGFCASFSHMFAVAKIAGPIRSAPFKLHTPRIHGELKMLGLDISERKVARWRRKAPRKAAHRFAGSGVIEAE